MPVSFGIHKTAEVPILLFNPEPTLYIDACACIDVVMFADGFVFIWGYMHG